MSCDGRRWPWTKWRMCGRKILVDDEHGPAMTFHRFCRPRDRKELHQKGIMDSSQPASMSLRYQASESTGVQITDFIGRMRARYVLLLYSYLIVALLASFIEWASDFFPLPSRPDPWRNRLSGLSVS